MAISKEHFEKGVDDGKTIQVKMFDFLKNDPEQAFTFEEIVRAAGIAEKAGLKTLIYQLMLENMFVDGVVDKKIIGLHSYYRIAD